jgi:hypothetical protein
MRHPAGCRGGVIIRQIGRNKKTKNVIRKKKEKNRGGRYKEKSQVEKRT